MEINIYNVPKAILHFVAGVIALYITWEVVPDILDILDIVGGVDGWNTIKQIIWFGIILLSVMYTIGYPMWVLFDEEN